MFVHTIPVTSAKDMFDAVTSHAPEMDLIIKAAAVADYRPSHIADEKVKNRTRSLQSLWNAPMIF